jgi:hypothetical protein
MRYRNEKKADTTLQAEGNEESVRGDMCGVKA